MTTKKNIIETTTKQVIATIKETANYRVNSREDWVKTFSYSDYYRAWVEDRINSISFDLMWDNDIDDDLTNDEMNAIFEAVRAYFCEPEKATASDVKEAWNVYQVRKASSEDLLDMCFADPDNEELDALSEAAYLSECEALDNLCNVLVSFTGGRVDYKTSKRLALCPKYSGRIDNLVRALAA